MQSGVGYKTAAWIGTVLFAVMAVIQVNDPDPLYWTLVYTGVAAVTLAAAFDRTMPRLALIVLGGVLAGILIAAPGFLSYLQSGEWASIGNTMSDEQPYIESGREFLGLAMAACALLLVLKRKPS